MPAFRFSDSTTAWALAIVTAAFSFPACNGSQGEATKAASFVVGTISPPEINAVLIHLHDDRKHMVPQAQFPDLIKTLTALRISDYAKHPSLPDNLPRIGTVTVTVIGSPIEFELRYSRPYLNLTSINTGGSRPVGTYFDPDMDLIEILVPKLSL